MISYKEAQRIIGSHARSHGPELIVQETALNRVLAKPIFADRDYPPFNRSTMDGFAVRYIDFEDGICTYSIKAVIYAGFATDEILQKGECYKIMTGAAVPDSADTVIKREDVNESEKYIELNNINIIRGQSIATKGGDLKQNDVILENGVQITATAMGALAVVGIKSISVQKLPNIVIFSTGDEVVTGDTIILPQQIRESNSIVLASMLKKFEIHSVKRIHLSDKELDIYNAIQKELNNDIIIITGGISAGDADFVPAVLERLGLQKIIQKVAIRPGKPFWFGKAVNGTVVFALPGNPVSAQVCYKLFVEHYLRLCFGMEPNPVWQLPLLHNRNKKVNLDEFFPCIIQQNPFGMKACSFNTSGDITSTVMSNGLAIHDHEKDQILKNDQIYFIPW
ncbi:MAG TPA: molybdopterin molybdotransferase MoeA [Saprospiraceae bacterium]|nr:molybdopterin molybdotransferase MoeA [Saprospiraceae bacterium]